MQRIVALGVAAAVLVVGSVYGSERGLRPVQVFEPDVDGIGTQNRDLVHDSRRVLYVGNQSGVLEFDGEWWRLIPLPNNSAVRSLAADDRGRVAVGGYDEIGVLEPEPSGRLSYRSLAVGLTESDGAFGDVWAIHPTNGGFCFVTDAGLYLWSPQTGVTIARRWANGRDLSRSVATDHGVLFWVSGEGLAWLEDGRLRHESSGDALAGASVAAMAADGNDVSIVLSDGTVFRWDGLSLSKFSSAIAPWAQNARISEAVVLNGGRLAVASVRSGVAILDQDGELSELLDRRSGMPDDHVPALTVGPDGALWLGLDGAIVRAGINSPLSVIDARLGLEGSVSGHVRHGRDFFVSTTQGVWRLDAGSSGEGGFLPRADHMSEIPGEPWSLASVGPDLFVGLSDGIIAFDGIQAREVPGSQGFVAYLLQQSIFDEHVVWAGLGEGLGRLTHEGAGWRMAGLVEGIPTNVRSVVEIDADRLCVGTTFDGAMLVTLEIGSERLQATDVRTLALGEVDCHLVNDRLLLTAEDGIVEADPDTGELESRADLNAIIGDDFAFRLVEDASGRLWLNTRPPRVAALGEDGAYVADDRGPIRMPGSGIQTMTGESDGVVWFGSEKGLVRYDTTLASEAPPLPAPLIRSVLAGRGDELDRVVPGGGEPMVPAGSGRLHFEFSATAFEPGTVYQYRLDPTDEGWSAWSATPFVDFTNLWEGDYRFLVRAKKAGRPPSTTAEFSFTVQPPWYRSPWAMVLWLLAVVVLPVVYARRRGSILKRRSAELEAVVDAKTAELADTVRELRRAQAESEAANTKLQQANERLRSLSHEDALTGIANRRKMEETLTAEWKRCRRSGSPLAVVVIDLDNFKRLNDAHGHQVGDDCLKEVAAALRRALDRSTDLAARFGGEEFVLVLPNTDLDGAALVAETTRRMVEGLRPNVGNGVAAALTVSLGAAAVVPVEGLSPDDLLAAADRALYDAKERGRNRVELADAPVWKDGDLSTVS